MYQIEITQQGKVVRTERIPAPSALAAIAQIEADYPAETVILNGRRYSWRGVDFVARKIS